MQPVFVLSRSFLGLVWLILLSLPVTAQTIYKPIPFTVNSEINYTLTDKDIPTGEGGFARDYLVKLQAGDQLAVDLVSDDFDAIILLLAADGSTIAENDDGPDGSTNALLFARVTETGDYIVRVRAFGETGGGKYSLKVTRLRPTP